MENTRNKNTLTKQMLKRSAIIAVVIGGALTVINQKDAILGEADLQIGRMILAFLTPFIVVAVSQVYGARSAHKAVTENSAINQGFTLTLFSHGILARSSAMGLIAGGANTAFAAIANITAGQNINQLPLNLILPAVLLPVIFGALSQVLSFKRTIRQLA